jgi:hypothetical protein
MYAPWIWGKKGEGVYKVLYPLTHLGMPENYTYVTMTTPIRIRIGPEKKTRLIIAARADWIGEMN